MKVIVSNAGYEAYKDKCPRGGSFETETKYNYDHKLYTRNETTKYYGNHVVQAIAISDKGEIYHSDYLIVKVR